MNKKTDLLRNIILTLISCIVFIACSSHDKDADKNRLTVNFTIKDFYKSNAKLDSAINKTISKLSPEARAGQMIVVAAGRLGKSTSYVDKQIAAGRVGGVLLLNGSVQSFKKLRAHFDSVSLSSGALPLVFSADAEPSLINRKIKDSTPVPKTIELRNTQKCRETGKAIADVLNDIGVQQGYAPVVDVSATNVVISNRSFGSDPDSIVLLAGAFISTLQNNNIIATAKHFPGHGLVKGDSHSGLVYIDGDLKEVSVYTPLIKDGLLSIMVGHIAVKNNKRWGTDGYPATCSGKIVTNLLKNEMGFKGLIITDAMNMGALTAFPNAPLLAVRAGCDIILMPADEDKLVQDIVSEMENDEVFREQINVSVRKIIRIKLCLGLISVSDQKGEN